jgi:hypothetical protein
MDVAQLVDIALAQVEARRIEIGALEPAQISKEALGGLAGVLNEMATNSVAVLAPDERVRVVGSWVEDTYLISITSDAMAISGDGITVINRLLGDPDLALGIASAARLAAHHHLAVRLAPDRAGTAIRVTVPAHLVEKPREAMVDEPTPLFTPHELASRVLVPVDGRDETEAFLESIFGALRDPWREPDRAERAVLRVREPGESFSVDADDAPSSAAAEAAVDLRSALSTFDQGRRSAALSAETIEATA